MASKIPKEFLGSKIIKAGGFKRFCKITKV